MWGISDIDGSKSNCYSCPINVNEMYKIAIKVKFCSVSSNAILTVI